MTPTKDTAMNKRLPEKMLTPDFMDRVTPEQLAELKAIAYAWMDNARAGLEANQLDAMVCTMRATAAHGGTTVIFGDMGACFVAINITLRKLIEAAGSFEALTAAADDYMNRKAAQKPHDDTEHKL